VSATLGFVLFLGWETFHWTWVFAFMIGGIAAAPLAAYLVKIIPSYLMGVLVGGFIILTNMRTLIHSVDWIPDSWTWPIYSLLLTLWVVALGYQWSKRHRFAGAQTSVDT
jgi:uncharacterized membrane protein YfcA